jgi:hypothetical protein
VVDIKIMAQSRSSGKSGGKSKAKGATGKASGGKASAPKKFGKKERTKSTVAQRLEIEKSELRRWGDSLLREGRWSLPVLKMLRTSIREAQDRLDELKAGEWRKLLDTQVSRLQYVNIDESGNLTLSDVEPSSGATHRYGRK